MLELHYNNDYVTIKGDFTKEIIAAIKEECSYKVPSAEWSPKFQSGQWSGSISLLHPRNLTFPSGLLTNVTNLLAELKLPYTICDQRQLPIKQTLAKVDISPYKFRDYQEEAIEIVEEKQRGILQMPTGSGKTKCASGIIARLSSYPICFVVPSVSLLHQTVEEFKESLNPLDKFSIGSLGGGTFSIGDLNVCTYQTLLSAYDKKYSEAKKKIIDIEVDKTSLESLERQLKILQVDLENSPAPKLKSIKKKYKDVESKIEAKLKMRENKAKIRELIASCQLLIIDETHIAAEIIECISLNAKNAYYKLGLSATASRQDNQDIRMFGSSGPIIFSVTASDLIRKGYLVKPFIYVIDLELDKTSVTYQETYKNAIVLNQQRNELIRDLAIEMHSQGRPTLIMVERIEHGKILEELIGESSLFVPGGDGSDDREIPEAERNYRRYQLDRLERGEIIMIGTSWVFTGIDAPKISCLILGCSMGSPTTTMQQIGRVLRKAEGKLDAIILDFRHKEKSLRSHSNSRIKAYRTESEFEVKILKYDQKTQSYT